MGAAVHRLGDRELKKSYFLFKSYFGQDIKLITLQRGPARWGGHMSLIWILKCLVSVIINGNWTKILCLCWNFRKGDGDALQFCNFSINMSHLYIAIHNWVIHIQHFETKGGFPQSCNWPHAWQLLSCKWLDFVNDMKFRKCSGWVYLSDDHVHWCGSLSIRN